MVVTILSLVAIFIITCVFICCKYNESILNEKKYNYAYPVMIVFIAVIVRIICVFSFDGHGIDLRIFRTWASRLADDGFAAFYSSGEFNNYPPGYMYVLWVIGKLNTLFHFPSDQAFNIVLKIPSIIVDILGGIFIYRIAKKKFSENVSLILMAFWLFNPAVIANSSVWGQTDVIYTLAITVMIYFIAERKLIYSYFMFALCIFLKPQSFIIMPVLIYGIIEQVFLEGFDKKNFIKNLCWGCVAIIAMFVLTLPYGVQNVINQYVETLKGGEYISQNAFNFWAAIGKNYVQVTTASSICGFLFIVMSVAFTAIVFFTNKNKGKYYLVGAFLILSSYMLSIKMNERYAFCAIMLFMMYFIENPKKETGAICALISCSQFFNTVWVLFVVGGDFQRWYSSKWLWFFSWINVVIYGYIIYVVVKEHFKFLQIKKGNKIEEQTA